METLQQVPMLGDRVLIVATGYHFEITKRTRKADGPVFLWDKDTPHLLSDCKPLTLAEIANLPVIEPVQETPVSKQSFLPMPGETIVRRFAIVGGKRHQVSGWSGEVISVMWDEVEVYLLPDKHWEKNPPVQTWPLSDCRPSHVTQEELQRIAGIRANYQKEKQAKQQQKAAAQVGTGTQLEVGNAA